MQQRSLEGRTVVVTGATGALGKAVVARLLQEGASCILPSRHEAESPDQGTPSEGVTVVPGVDPGDADAVEAFYAALPDLWASIHTAGAFAMSPVAGDDTGAYDRMMDANARTAFVCSRSAARAMLRTGTAGRIVNIASRPGLEPRTGKGMAAYAASKAAVAAMTVAMAEELKDHGILVNAVAPSTMDTPANRIAMSKADFTRWVRLEDAAEAIVDLVSPRNAAISGALIPIYGRA